MKAKARIKNLSPEQKRELLARVLRKKAEEASRYPLSYSQERIWLLHQLDPSGSAYNLCFSLRIKGDVQLPVIERAVNEILRRHRIVRAGFQLADGRPVQVISPEPSTVTLPVVDLSALDASELEQEIQRISLETARQPFDLSTPPLFRPLVLRFDPVST